jgi:hypothetical protein
MIVVEFATLGYKEYVKGFSSRLIRPLNNYSKGKQCYAIFWINSCILLKELR